MNASRTEPVHFLQMWVPPDAEGIEPSYEQRDVSSEYAAGGMFPLASGRDADAAIKIHQRDATLWIAHLAPGEQARLPDAPFVHLFVARGSIELDGAPLGTGDAVRTTAEGPVPLRAGDDGAELTLWETWSDLP
jgi:quercetin 2,3-dioxygenase